MQEKNYTGIVPDQHTGKAIDSESSIVLNNVEQAKEFFNIVKNRLLDINKWHEIAGTLSAKFQLSDNHGKKIERSAREGDYVRIDISGPGAEAGDGYDWVLIEEIKNMTESETESFGLRVRPAQDPVNQDNKIVISHFYSAESTSSFTVTREGNKITAAIYDRNTKTNKQTGSSTDKVRDAIVGTVGILAFSKIQWKTLTDGLVKNEQ